MIKQNQRKRPEVNKQIVLGILVIALSVVIAVKANSVSVDQPSSSSSSSQDIKKTSAASELATANLESKSLPSAASAEPEKGQKVSVEAEKVQVDKGVENSESKLSPKADAAQAEEAAGVPIAGSDKLAAPSKESDSANKSADIESNKRKARAETASTTAAAPSEAAKQETTKSAEKKSESKLEPKASPAAKPVKQLAKSASKSKLPANLGTVTSTGSGGHSYMSKHDAYSAIAEKHGALAQDAIKKSDKRQLQTGFGSIQKASGIGDMLSPFKGVTDSGLARTLGASMRSIMKSKYSVPAYVASALLGAVALMAFYESPISPLPVPPLPEPPVGRFPPEMPNLPVGTQVPFRGNQQGGQYGQSYNQRSLNQQLSGPQNYLAQQAQQVLFPGNNVAQQRQSNVANTPVQLASNLLSSVGKPQVAQRKSSPDYDLSSRSFFSSLPTVSVKQGNALGATPAAASQQKQSNSFLSYFGLGGQSTSVPSDSNMQLGSQSQGAMQMSGMSNSNQQNFGNSPLASTGSIEPKGEHQAGALSNSHLVNKVKSLFNRSPVSQSSSGSSHSSSSVSNAAGNPYAPYQRMSLVQALMKDTAFIPGFLSPTRKSSASSGSQAGANKIQSTITNALSGSPNPSSRMQIENGPSSLQLPAASKQNKPSDGGFGLYRVAHALLDTFTSGHPRTASHGSSNQLSDGAARKSSSSDDSSSLEAATTLFGDIMSSYNSNNGEQKSQQQQQQQQQLHEKSSQTQSSSSSQSSPSSQSGNQQQSPSASNQQPSNDQVSARSGDLPPSNNDEHDQQQVKSHSQQASNNNNKQQSPAAPPASSQDAHVRKTRSIGLEYPIEYNQELARREQQLPSKASQINNVIDFVADSYSQNRMLFNFVMNQVGLSQAVPYVEQILAPGANENH